MTESSILYENPGRTVFLIDIPTSITLAQDLSPTQQQHQPTYPEATKYPTSTKQKEKKKKHLLSTPPLKIPYPSPKPKTDKARAKVLERIPAIERAFHVDVIEPLVEYALRDIDFGYGDGYGGVQEWCFGRVVIDDDGVGGRAGPPIPEPEEGSRERRYNGDLEYRDPPVILSPTCVNTFESVTGLRDVVVKNTSSQSASLAEEAGRHGEEHRNPRVFNIPALCNFLLCTLSMSQSCSTGLSDLIPGLPRDQKFNLILLDPPWPNRSVRRSGHYHTQLYLDMDILTQHMRGILQVYLFDTIPEETSATTNESGEQTHQSIAAIWITNGGKARKAAYEAMQNAGLCVCEEWIWIKTTTNGIPITPVDGLWRKPYEILIIGKKEKAACSRDLPGNVTRRVIAAVPDVHSRKPNLREIFEKVFFSSSTALRYSALEVFARNLTAGWWACGDEVLKFNEEGWWTED